ncbi:MAG TPA: MBL fold metallo-hydrolase [Dehalococcoidia bacterium]|nr:MBL fold metallo-hydrolase [Dehalococcoidia bacterium]
MAQVTLEPIDGVTITTVLDNVSDALMADQGVATRARSAGASRLATRITEAGEVPDALVAQHGFSALIDFQRNGQSHTVLFDTGVTPDGAVDNLDRLQRDLRDVEAIVLSHGHFDHVVGMDGVWKRLGQANLPVYIHPEFWSRRRVAIPGQEPIELPVPSRSALEGAGFDIIEERQPSFLLHDSLLITGEVDRTTEFEKGFAVHQAFHDGDWQPDPLILDDQAAIMHVRGKGLVVLTGCGHAGIVNIVRYAQRLTGVEDVYAVLGGFHLTGGQFEPIIPATVAALGALDPSVVVPAHCTGWRAIHDLAAALPDAFIQNSVGTRFEL